MAYMQKKGVGRNDIVPIIAIQSWHMIAAILGMLKAGGAYMHIDSYYHKDKIEGIIEAAQSKIALLYGVELKCQVQTVDLSYPCNEAKIIAGEICVQGNNVMLGYYQDEDDAKEVMSDCWFHTGDL